MFNSISNKIDKIKIGKIRNEFWKMQSNKQQLVVNGDFWTFIVGAQKKKNYGDDYFISQNAFINNQLYYYI